MKKDFTNREISDLLRSISAAYEIADEEKNRFRIIAYDRAATAIEHLSSEVKDIWDEGKLEDISGIGPNIAKHLDELFKKGSSKHFDDIKSNLPEGMFELMKVRGIGAKTAFKLAKTLKLNKKENALKILEEKLKKGSLKNIEGFGEKSQELLIKSVKEEKERKFRMLLPFAWNISEDLKLYLMKFKNNVSVDPLGSLRRMNSTVGDIDIAIASTDIPESIRQFTSYPKVKRVLEKGVYTASIMLKNNIQVDVMVQNPESYGSLLQHFTGSKQHNIALRELALSKGYSLSEYGLKDIKHKNKIKKFKSEKDLYNFLKLEWIPPELREDAGEIREASKQNIPKLIELEDIKSDLQIHSNFDTQTSHDLGTDSMKTIINKANELGYEYIAFTEHNPSKGNHSELEILNIIKQKKKEIDDINYSIQRSVKERVIYVFNSLEIDIDKDGNLQLPLEGLDYLDFALVSVHSSFNLTKEENTNRILKALNNKKVKIFAHPTTRLLNVREGLEYDWKKIFEFCRDNNKWIEINADPQRLDLPDYLIKEAIDYKVKMTFGTDSHLLDSMENMRWGVANARRGWAKKDDIINSLSLKEFKKLI